MLSRHSRVFLTRAEMRGSLERDLRVARQRMASFPASVTLLSGGLHNSRDGIFYDIHTRLLLAFFVIVPEDERFRKRQNG